MYTENHLQVPDGETSTLDAEEMEQRLGHLIQKYSSRRSKKLAQLIVEYIDAMTLFPYGCNPDQRCDYRRLARHWRWLAGIQNPGTAAPHMNGRSTAGSTAVDRSFPVFDSSNVQGRLIP